MICFVCLQCYSLATIGYRVAIFNDCEEASESLKQVFYSIFFFISQCLEFPLLNFFKVACVTRETSCYNHFNFQFLYLQEIKDAREDLARKGFKFD